MPPQSPLGACTLKWQHWDQWEHQQRPQQTGKASCEIQTTKQTAVLLSCSQKKKQAQAVQSLWQKERMPSADRVTGRRAPCTHTAICACQTSSNGGEQECDCKSQRHHCRGPRCLHFHWYCWTWACENMDCLWPRSSHTYDRSSWNCFCDRTRKGQWTAILSYIYRMRCCVCLLKKDEEVSLADMACIQWGICDFHHSESATPQLKKTPRYWKDLW